MASGGGPEWKEWIPLTPLLDQLPQQFQRGLATSDLQLTCLASLPQHLVLGTNVGLVYLAHLPSLNLMRLKCEVRIRYSLSVEYMHKRLRAM